MENVILKQQRIRMDKTQEEMAHELGITPMYYSKIERGVQKISKKIERRIIEMMMKQSVAEDEEAIINGYKPLINKDKIENILKREMTEEEENIYRIIKGLCEYTEK